MEKDPAKSILRLRDGEFDLKEVASGVFSSFLNSRIGFIRIT